MWIDLIKKAKIEKSLSEQNHFHVRNLFSIHSRVKVDFSAVHRSSSPSVVLRFVRQFTYGKIIYKVFTYFEKENHHNFCRQFSNKTRILSIEIAYQISDRKIVLVYLDVVFKLVSISEQ